jgi:hypothetical protein
MTRPESTLGWRAPSSRRGRQPERSSQSPGRAGSIAVAADELANNTSTMRVPHVRGSTPVTVATDHSTPSKMLSQHAVRLRSATSKLPEVFQQTPEPLRAQFHGLPRQLRRAIDWCTRS